MKPLKFKKFKIQKTNGLSLGKSQFEADSKIGFEIHFGGILRIAPSSEPEAGS